MHCITLAKPSTHLSCTTVHDMIYFYGTCMHYIEKQDFPFHVKLNMGANEHGCAHFVDRDEYLLFKAEYKHVRRLRRELLCELQLGIQVRRTYISFLRAKFLDMTNEFKNKWGIE